MPQALIGVITPYVASFLFGIGGNVLAVAATGFLAGALVYGGLAVASYLVQAAFTPQAQKPEAPKPEDGKYNLKQAVPPLVYVLGEVKKAGDYAFLEERGGVAYHITVFAAHSIKGFKEHWLHDEKVTLNGSGTVTAPAHFGGHVNIQGRLGANASTAYANIVAAFTSIWTNAHRGDGLATVMMAVSSVAAEDLQKVYTSGMPQHSAVIEGHNRIYDPRTGTVGYTKNLGQLRLWHLTQPVGGKLTLDDMYMPDWAHAADVDDQMVNNRDGALVPRYHGGLWFRANNDPVQIGRLLDQAADQVIYERADGKIGVHAGEFVVPDTRLSANDLISVSYDANQRRGTNVLAVRGRFTDPDKGFNTTDAAIYGVPYPTDDERTKTVENQAVQDHNHIARMEKLAYIRANAPRVKVVAHYEPARNVPYRRFVRVHYPPKMTEAIVEITGRPTLSLRNLTYAFGGIVVPPTLYAFIAAIEEGAPGSSIVPVVREDVPEPEDFEVTVETEAVGSGSTAAFFLASLTSLGDAFQTELEWRPTSGGAVQSVLGLAGAPTVRSSYVADGVEYDVRGRTWSAGAPSEWTAPQTLTATADPVPPGVATGVVGTGGVGEVTFDWVAPNSANYAGCRLTIDGVLVATEYGAPNTADSRVVTGVPPGTYAGAVVAINRSGVEAAPVATLPIIVT